MPYVTYARSSHGVLFRSKRLWNDGAYALAEYLEDKANPHPRADWTTCRDEDAPTWAQGLHSGEWCDNRAGHSEYVKGVVE